jgi:hypothetical protein
VNLKPVAVETGAVAVGTSASGKSLTTADAADVTADEDPILFIAITETLMYLLMSSSVNTYVLFLADGMSAYVPVDVSERFH